MMEYELKPPGPPPPPYSETTPLHVNEFPSQGNLQILKLVLMITNSLFIILGLLFTVVFVFLYDSIKRSALEEVDAAKRPGDPRDPSGVTTMVTVYLVSIAASMGLLLVNSILGFFGAYKENTVMLVIYGVISFFFAVSSEYKVATVFLLLSAFAFALAILSQKKRAFFRAIPNV